MRTAALALFAWGGPAAAAGLTGTYVGRNDHQAFVLQVVQTGNQVTGRYEQFDVKPGGKYEDVAGTFAAVVDGKSFAGTIKLAGLLASTMPVSGELSDGALHVDGDSSFHLALTPGDQGAFRAAVATLKGAASVADRNAHLEDLIKRMAAFRDNLQHATSALPQLEERVMTDTARMSAALARERAIAGGGQASVARGQASVGIHQLGVDASQARAAVDASMSQLHPASQRLVSEAALARLGCKTHLGAGAMLQACPRFLDADLALKASIEEGRVAFGKFDDVWDRESTAQASLIRDSDVAVK